MKFYNTDDLESEKIKLVLEKTSDEIPEKRYVPAYHFSICLTDDTKVGECCLRVGHNKNTYYGGNIGYGVDEEFRGHGYAAKACRLIYKLAEKHDMKYVLITCDPDNAASARTCENIGCSFIETTDVPPDTVAYQHGIYRVNVYKYKL